MKKILLAIAIVLAAQCAAAAGIGSMNWGDSYSNYDEGGSGSFIGFVMAIGSVLGSWWLAFSSKSPIKNNFFARALVFLFGPAVFLAIVFSLMP